MFLFIFEEKINKQSSHDFSRSHQQTFYWVKNIEGSTFQIIGSIDFRKAFVNINHSIKGLAYQSLISDCMEWSDQNTSAIVSIFDKQRIS